MMGWRVAGLLAALVGIGPGCGPQPMPKGAGASGKSIAVVEKPELGLALINRLTADQQRSFDWLHRPFAEAATPFEALPAPAAARLEKAKGLWDSIDFVDVGEDKQVLHLVRFITTVGNYQVVLAAKYVPNHARSFLALARSGFFDGAPLALDGAVATIGSRSDPELFSVQQPDRPLTAPNAGSLVAMRSQRDGADSGSGFFLCLGTPDPPKSKPLTVVGAGMRDETFPTLEKIQAALQKSPGSVRIERIEITEQSTKLFGVSGPNLPVVSPDGKLISPDSGGP